MANPREFRLRQVLELEQSQEEAKQLELSSLQQQRREAEQQIQALYEAAEQLRRSVAAPRGGRVDPAELVAAGAYLDGIAESIRAHEAVTQHLETQVLASREQLVEILRRRRMLEHLRDRHAADLAASDERRERNAADELSSGRVARQAKEAR